MINRVIAFSIEYRGMMLALCFALSLFGIKALLETPVDAIPDLSEVQVVVKTHFAGQAPQVVEDQVTYPLTSTLLSVPNTKSVRGFSFFGDSFIYVIFEEGTDLYWARSRVQEYLATVSSELPNSVKPELGPDATGVGWVFMYALKDTSGVLNLAELTSLQDWHLRYALQTVNGVAEVATVGGMKKRYLVEVNPAALLANRLALRDVIQQIQANNLSFGASVIEQAEAEYMLNVSAELSSLQELASVPLKAATNGSIVRLKDVARVFEAPEPRRSVADLNGEGEVVGGVVVMRVGENPYTTIANVKAKLKELANNLPDGVKIIPVYDRSALISASLANLWEKVWQELLIIFIVTAIFLKHARSAFVALLILPIGLLITFLCLRIFSININIMSLGGIVLAMGAMVDAAVVMVENLHRKYREQTAHTSVNGKAQPSHWTLVYEACTEVGPAIFFSLLIITVSFLPVFGLAAEEGKLFSPLAFTKTFAMALTAVLGITLVPILTGFIVSARSITTHSHQKTSRYILRYQHYLQRILHYPKSIALFAFALSISTIFPWFHLGNEFMPPLDEGDIMYMPTTSPGVSVGKSRELLQQAHRTIKAHPEVLQVFGKAGRAESATDPAPLSMIESVIQLKPKSQWRKGVTLAQIKKELDERVKFPGLNNAWLMPIRTRIDMQSTGVKTPLGIKVSGDNLAELQRITAQLESLLKDTQGTLSVYAEQPNSGRYIDIQLDRDKLAQRGLNVSSLSNMINASVTGNAIAFTRENRERYGVSLRYPEKYRDSLERLITLPLIQSTGDVLRLGDVASLQYAAGPSVIKSENGQLSSWLYIDYDHPNLAAYIQQSEKRIAQHVPMPAGYHYEWTGQYQAMDRATKSLSVLVPLTLGIIVCLLYFSLQRIRDVLLVLLTLPVALSGSLWLLYWMNFKLSVAVVIGLIALAGLAVEIGILMTVYLNQSMCSLTAGDSKREAIVQGAGQRVRPILMTSLSVALGLLPILLSDGVGNDVMARIVAPVIGGLCSVLLFSLVLLPATYLLMHREL